MTEHGWSKSSQQQVGAVLRNFATCEICRLQLFATLQNFHCLPILQHFCSKFPLVRSCIFEFSSGSSCLNQIEYNEAFVPTCEICRLQLFATLQNFHCLPVLQHFCSKFPLVRSCIFKFGSGSSCLNRIEDNEAFDLQNY